MSSKAPSDIRADLALLRQDQSEYFNILTRYNFDQRRMMTSARPEEQEVLNRVLDGNRKPLLSLITYLKEHCSEVDIPTFYR